MNHVKVSFEKALKLQEDYRFLETPANYELAKVQYSWIKLLVLPYDDNNRTRFYGYYIPEHIYSEKDVFETGKDVAYTIIVAASKVAPLTTESNTVIQRFGLIEYLKLRKIPFKAEELPI